MATRESWIRQSLLVSVIGRDMEEALDVLSILAFVWSLVAPIIAEELWELLKRRLQG